MNKSESIKEIATALCKFQGEVDKIIKTETNPFFHNKYADLSSILDVVRNPMVKNGLSIVQFPVGKCELETVLMHTSGEWMSGTYEMRPTKDDPQGAGSVITYQRRYALGAVLGLNIDIDDDGNKGSEPKKESENRPAVEKWMSEKQFETIKTLLSGTEKEEYERGIINFEMFSKFPYGMKKEYRAELESIVKKIKE
jgi:hypothetical protein